MDDNFASGLDNLGWTEEKAWEFQNTFGSDLLAGRIMRGGGSLYLVSTSSGQVSARVSGAFEFRAMAAADFPSVGDWVAVQWDGMSESQARIEGILPRRGVVSRKQVGQEAEEQVLAANVTLACILLSIDNDRKCSPRLAQRYVTTVRAGSVEPIIVLNKIDLSETRERTDRIINELARALPDVMILPLSCETREGFDAVKQRMRSGETAVLLGPSGVGKSTFVNLLAGVALQSTAEVRSQDGKGRHTTTHRELVPIPGGPLVIDTPGLRELGIWADEDDVADAFPDVLELAATCRFNDCTHGAEPGCGVQRALADGTLLQERYDSYLSLLREAAYLSRKSDERLQRAEREKWKRINSSMRGFSKERRSRYG